MGAKERVDAYLDTVRRLEPDITPLDYAAAAASIAISLKRIADVLEWDAHWKHQQLLDAANLPEAPPGWLK